MRNRDENARRQLLTTVLIVFLGFLGISVPYLIFPAFFLNPEYSLLSITSSNEVRSMMLGVTLAAYPLGQFIGSPVLGALSDQHGRKRLLTMTLIASAVFNIMTGLSLALQLLPLLIFTRFLAGFMEGNIAIARAMAADITSISKHDSFGKMNAAGSIGYLVGPLLGALLTGKELFSGATIATPFYVVGGLFLAIALIAVTMLKSDTVKVNPKRQTLLTQFNLPKKLSILFRNKELRFWLIVSTLFTLAVDIFYEFGPVYLTAKWMLSPLKLASFNSMLCISIAIGNGWLAAYVMKRFSSRTGIFAAFGVFTFLLLAIVLTNRMSPTLILYALCGFAIGVEANLVTVALSDSAGPSIQGEVMGVQMALRVLGDAVICLFGGALLTLSPKIILGVAAFISLSTMLYFYYSWRVSTMRLGAQLPLSTS